MKTRDLVRIGVPRGDAVEVAKQLLQHAKDAKRDMRNVTDALRRIAAAPETATADPVDGEFARLVQEHHVPTSTRFVPRAARCAVPDLGRGSRARRVKQMRNACKLPVAVAGALMPDAHVGYGLPIGGVLATRNAVIPYAVGVDIACRMKLTVLDLPLTRAGRRPGAADATRSSARRASASARRSSARRQHDVMDADWRVTAVTARLKDKAWTQLGTSGSGNHFVEFGVLTLDEAVGPAARASTSRCSATPAAAAPARRSREHYSKRRARAAPGAAEGTAHLAWLDLVDRGGPGILGGDGADGPLRGGQPRVIHRHVARASACEVLLDVENHHNFAWREKHGAGRHRRRGDRPSQGRDAGGRGRAGHHSRLDGARPATSSAARASPRRSIRPRTAPGGG